MTLLDCIGHTPLLRLERLSRILGANIYAKLESRNPGGSIQDRAALAYILGAKQRGCLTGPRCIVEAVDAYLGISLAVIGLKFDVRFLLCTPASTSRYAVNLMRELGAEVIVTPAEQGVAGALEKASFHRGDTWGSYRPDVFCTQDGVQAHYATTGAELVGDAVARRLHVDAFVSGVWSGASITGIGRRLLEWNKDIHIAAVEPAASPVLSGGAAGPHGIPGIGAGLIPATLDRTLLSEVLVVTDEEARAATRRLHSMEGILAGLASGANLHGVLLLARRPEFKGKTIVTIISEVWRPF